VAGVAGVAGVALASLRLKASEVKPPSRDFSMQMEFPHSATPELLQLLNFCALKPHNLRTSNIGIREERFNDRFIGHRVEVQDGEYFSAAMVSAQRHVRNIYRVRSENGA